MMPTFTEELSMADSEVVPAKAVRRFTLVLSTWGRRDTQAVQRQGTRLVPSVHPRLLTGLLLPEDSWAAWGCQPGTMRPSEAELWVAAGTTLAPLGPLSPRGHRSLWGSWLPPPAEQAILREQLPRGRCSTEMPRETFLPEAPSQPWWHLGWGLLPGGCSHQTGTYWLKQCAAESSHRSPMMVAPQKCRRPSFRLTCQGTSPWDAS